MNKHTNFRIGGPARFFVEVKSADELREAIKKAKAEPMPFVVFGGGSNLLVNDQGFDGLVIKMAMREIRIQDRTLEADAGALSSAVARKAAHAGLAGFSWAISLPGTIGGAMRGNAGCFGGEIKDHVTSVDVLRDGKVMRLEKKDLAFGYRESLFKHNQDIVLSALFSLERAGIDELKKELEEKLAQRKSSQPLHAGSAGCIFKNVEISNDEELQRLTEKIDLPLEMRQARRLSAGWLIDQLDLKGMQIGQAKISEIHGNFIVNLGSATADEVLELIAIMKSRARNEFGIQLQEEIQLI